jgi:hypothetical protein
MAESDKLDNAKEGLFLGTTEDWQQKDIRAIGPNGKAPAEVSPTSFVLGPNHPS